jgi:Tfp pilus assembly protein PilF
MNRPGPSRPAGFQPHFLQTILILLAGFWAYFPCLQGEWMWDDGELITGNPLMHDPAGLWKIWFQPGVLIDYYPATFTLQRLEWNIWGTDTSGYHFVNLALHLASSFLVWRLLERLGVKLAFWGGLLFAVHPLTVESVAWISELKNALSLPPMLLALLFWIDYDERARPRDYALALALFLFAMLCKSSVAMLPLVLLLYAWWKRGKIVMRDLLSSAPFFVVALALGAFDNHIALQHPGPAELPGIDALARLDTAGHQVFVLLGLCLFPFHLMPIYPSGVIASFRIIDLLPWLSLIALAAVAWRHRRTWGRHVLLGFGFYLANLLPGLVYIDAKATTMIWSMDHLLYISIIGIIGLEIAALSWLLDRASRGPRLALTAAAAACTAILALGTHAYAGLYGNAFDFWQYAAQANPGSWSARLNFGEALLQRGDAAGALEQFQAGQRLNPDYFSVHLAQAQALDALGRRDEAIAENETALKLNPYNPEAASALGDIYFIELGQLPKATEYYQTALRIDPGNAAAHYELGSIFYRTGNFPQAAITWKKRSRSSPVPRKATACSAKSISSSRDCPTQRSNSNRPCSSRPTTSRCAPISAFVSLSCIACRKRSRNSRRRCRSRPAAARPTTISAAST